MTSQEQNYNAGASHRHEIQKEINANPIVRDKSILVKTKEEKKEVKKQQNRFKHDGLKDWNDRNRPGNNKKEDIKDTLAR